MRIFKLKCRVLRTKKVTNQATYLGLEKFMQFGVDTYKRYHDPESKWQPRVAELYELIGGKLKLVTLEDVLNKI